MTSELTPEWFEMIWKYSIVPEVEESFEDLDKLREFANLPHKFHSNEEFEE